MMPRALLFVLSLVLALPGQAQTIDLSDVSLTCQPGTVTALVRPNGAGKSTLLSVIAGDHTPDSGEVLLNDRPLHRFSIRDLAQLRSVFPQGSAIRFGYQVHEVVAMGRAFRDLPPGEDDAVIGRAMAQAEIAHMAWRDAQTLSGGEQARTTFARVLAQDCPIVLLDEPTAALDLRHQERVLAGAATLALGLGGNLVAQRSDDSCAIRRRIASPTGAKLDAPTCDILCTCFFR